MAAYQQIFDNTKKYIDIAEKKSAYYPIINQALAIVKKFIADKKRILYGGMAIDGSLKLADPNKVGIYANDAIPDYDFISPDFYQDSIELADLLYKEKMPNVSAINAIHVTTRRVRVNFIPVADITYFPPNIYKQLPTLSYNGLLIVHPTFQRLDMHRAFCTPYEKPPLEVFMGRSKKDQKRFHLLDGYYPIPVKNIKYQMQKVKKVEIPSVFLQNQVLGGFPAYAWMYKIYTIICEKYKLEIDPLIIPLNCNFSDSGVISLEWPEDFPISIPINIISDDYESLLEIISNNSKPKSVKYFNKYLDDFRPRTIEIITDDLHLEIFDNFTRKLPIFDLEKLLHFWKITGSAEKKVNKKDKKDKTKDKKDKNENHPPKIAQAQYLLLYFLLKYFNNLDDEKDGKNDTISQFYLNMYHSLELMIIKAEEISDKLPWEMVPFFLSPNVYGEGNLSPDYIDFLSSKLDFIFEREGKSLRPPFGYYPDSGNKPQEFNPEDSDLFQIDGLECKNPFEELTL